MGAAICGALVGLLAAFPFIGQWVITELFWRPMSRGDE